MATGDPNWEEIEREFHEDYEICNLNVEGTQAFEAWLLGPKGENAALLEELVTEAIHDLSHWRRNYKPGDSLHITEALKTSRKYRDATAKLKDDFHLLLDFLKRSVPAFSMRYQAHMGWDLTIPSILGYFAAMLHNPNNIAYEGGPATTILEMLVMRDICQMLGFEAEGEIHPWGHITGGGTIANIEALWASRNLKFYPVALQAALREESSLNKAKGLDVELPGQREPTKLVDLDTWSLVNLRADNILALPDRAVSMGVSREDLEKAMASYDLPHLGIQEFSSRFPKVMEHRPVFIVPGSKHYSFDKAMSLLGVGTGAMIAIPLDEDARLSIRDLRERLETCLKEQRAVYTVVVVMGSTEESAVDPLADVVKLRQEFREKGLDFTIHADAAWGGYHVSLIRDHMASENGDQPLLGGPADQGNDSPSSAIPGDPGDQDRSVESLASASSPLELQAVNETPSIMLNAYVTKHFQLLGHVESITIDPHKQGYIPYPCGAICYRNRAMRYLLTFNAPYIYQKDQGFQVGMFGVEGSRPGAAAAAVFLSHRVIRPTKTGYGNLIGKTLFNCKQLYAMLRCMADPVHDDYIVVPLPRVQDRVLDMLKEAEGGEDGPDLLKYLSKFLKTRILEADNKTIANDELALRVLQEIGPDLNILAYAFNFKVEDSEGRLQPNPDLDRMNDFNRSIYAQLSLDPSGHTTHYDLIVSATEFQAESYGKVFIEDYKKRLGIQSAGDRIFALRSVVMDPWITSTSRGSFLKLLEKIMREAIGRAREQLHKEGQNASDTRNSA